MIHVGTSSFPFFWGECTFRVSTFLKRKKTVLLRSVQKKKAPLFFNFIFFTRFYPHFLEHIFEHQNKTHTHRRFLRRHVGWTPVRAASHAQGTFFFLSFFLRRFRRRLCRASSSSSSFKVNDDWMLAKMMCCYYLLLLLLLFDDDDDFQNHRTDTSTSPAWTRPW